MRIIKDFFICCVLTLLSFGIVFAGYGVDPAIIPLRNQPETRDIGESTVTYHDPVYYIPGQENTIRFGVQCISPDGEYLVGIIKSYPEGWEVVGMAQEEEDWAQYYNDNIAVWGDPDGNWSWPDPYLYNGVENWFEAIVDIPHSAIGEQIITIDLIGDGWGSPPHQVIGIELTLTELTSSIYLMPFESFGETCSGGSINFDLELWNYTSDAHDILISYDAPIDYTLDISPLNIILDPGSTEIISITVNTPPDAPHIHTEEIIIIADPLGPDKELSGSASIYITTYTDFSVGLGSPMNDARFDLAAVEYNGKILAIGAQGELDGDPLPNRSIEAYCPIEDSWEYIASIPDSFNLGYGNILSAAVEGDYLLIQNPGDAVWPIYNLSSDTWSSTITPFGDSFGGQLVSWDGLIYIIGGMTGEYATNRLYSYDVYTDTYTQLADMPEHVYRYLHMSYAFDNKIYMIGGFHGQIQFNENLYYDISDGEWYYAEPMPASLWGGVAAVSGVISQIILT